MKKVGLVLEFPTDSNFYMYCLLSKELLLYNIELNIYIPQKNLYFNKKNIVFYSKHIPIIKENINDINNCDCLILTNLIEKINGNKLLIRCINNFQKKKIYLHSTNCWDLYNFDLNYNIKLANENICKCKKYSLKNVKNFSILENFNFKKEIILSKEDFVKKYNLNKNSKLIAIFLCWSSVTKIKNYKDLLLKINEINKYLKTIGYEMIGKLHRKEGKPHRNSIPREKFIKLLNIPICDNVYQYELFKHSDFCITMLSSLYIYCPSLNIPTLNFDVKCMCEDICKCKNIVQSINIKNENYEKYVVDNGILCKKNMSSYPYNRMDWINYPSKYYGFTCFIEDFIINYKEVFEIFLNKNYSNIDIENFNIWGDLTKVNIKNYTKNILEYIDN